MSGQVGGAGMQSPAVAWSLAALDRAIWKAAFLRSSFLLPYIHSSQTTFGHKSLPRHFVLDRTYLSSVVREVRIC
jgi:hypothetical protein